MLNDPCCGARTPPRAATPCAAHRTTRPRDGARLAHGTLQGRAAMRRSPTAAPASSGSTCPDARLSTWVLADGVAPRLTRMTARTGDGGAADRESLLLLLGSPPCCNQPQMPEAARCDFFFVLVIRVLRFVRRSNGPVHQRRRASAQAATNRADPGAADHLDAPECNRQRRHPIAEL